MEFHKHLSLLAILFLTLMMLQKSCMGQNSPQDYLDAHNTARSEVGVEPMTWDDDVAAFAQNYANERIGDCNLQHSGDSSYGENLAEGSGDFTGRAAVELWVGEKPNYDRSSNSCVGGDGSCLHYTQVVWSDSKRLGCARVQCNNGNWFISCNYAPPGNVIGQTPY